MFCIKHRSIKVTLFSEIHIKIFSKYNLTYHQIAPFKISVDFMWSSPTVVIENTPFYHICQLLLRVFEVIRYVFLRWFIKLLSIIILLNSYLLFVTILFLTKYAVSHISALNSYLLFFISCLPQLHRPTLYVYQTVPIPPNQNCQGSYSKIL